MPACKDLIEIDPCAKVMTARKDLIKIHPRSLIKIVKIILIPNLCMCSMKRGIFEKE